MSKIGIKASAFAVSLSLALTPMGFAQSTAPAQVPVSVQATTNTQPLPGAKLAAAELGAGGFTAGQIAVFITVLAGLAILGTSSNNDNNNVGTTGTR